MTEPRVYILKDVNGLIPSRVPEKSKVVVINHDSIYDCDPDMREEKFFFEINKTLYWLKYRLLGNKIKWVATSVVIAGLIAIVSIMFKIIGSKWVLIPAIPAMAFIVFLVPLMVDWFTSMKRITMIATTKTRAVDPGLWKWFSSLKRTTTVKIKELKKQPMVEDDHALQFPTKTPRVVILKNVDEKTRREVKERGIVILDHDRVYNTSGKRPVESGEFIGRNNLNKRFTVLLNHEMREFAMRVMKRVMVKRMVKPFIFLSIVLSAGLIIASYYTGYIVATSILSILSASLLMTGFSFVTSFILCYMYTSFNVKLEGSKTRYNAMVYDAISKSFMNAYASLPIKQGEYLSLRSIVAR